MDIDELKARYLRNLGDVTRDSKGPFAGYYDPAQASDNTIPGHYASRSRVDAGNGTLQTLAAPLALAGAFAMPEAGIPLALAGGYEGLSGAGSLSDADKEAQAAQMWRRTGLPQTPVPSAGSEAGRVMSTLARIKRGAFGRGK